MDAHQNDEPTDYSWGSNFLEFIHYVERYRIPTVDPLVADPRRRWEAAVGTLGKGGQYVVDRTYNNQRYPNKKDLRAESNTVYKRIIWSRQQQERDSVHQTSQLAAFAKEVRALGYLQSSPHIIRLMGVAWEKDDHAQISPVLALEYAQHNSLAQFLMEKDNGAITWPEKKRLIGEIAEGIYHIHDAGFVWGDCKPENVLIAQSEDDPKSFSAKISDFGLSVYGGSEEAEFSGFSEPWISPEARTAVGMTALMQSEIYSMGLVFWAILLDGQPFQQSRWGPETQLVVDGDGFVTNADVMRLSKSGELRGIAIESFALAVSSSIPEIEIQFFGDILRRCLMIEPHTRPEARELNELLHRNPRPASLGKFTPDNRYGQFDMNWLITNFGPTTRLHEIGVKIFQDLKIMARGHALKYTTYQSGLCLATGFGCDRNLHAAVREISRSASLGHEPAERVLLPLQQLVKELAVDQSSLDLTADAPLIDLWDDFTSYQHDPGDDSRAAPQHPSTESSNLEITPYSTKGKEKASVKYPLHAAAVQNDLANIAYLLSECKHDIDQQDNNGCTALFCAASHGQHESFGALLRAGADLKKTDDQGRSILHAVAVGHGKSLDNMIKFLGKDPFYEQLKEKDLNDTVAANVSSCQSGAECVSGTALECAVDSHNLEAVEFLLELGSDPSVSHSGSSALHRATSRHDYDILSRLLKDLPTEALMRFDLDGRSPLACGIQHTNLFARLLFTTDDDNAFKKILRTISNQNHDLTRLNIVLENGESAVYYSVKSENIGRELIEIFWIWNWDDISSNVIPSPTGPNGWSAFRRALYCKSTSAFELLCSGIGPEVFRAIICEVSLDGLSMLHELAFLPDRLAVSFFQSMVDHAKRHNVRLVQSRLRPRGSRPRMTPFQLAVICGNIELADSYIANNFANPLHGLEKSRFLASAIMYPCQDPDILSTWLSQVLDDPIVQSMRKFPHPTGIERSLRYLLAHEEVWWKVARKNNGFSVMFSSGPNFDNNSEHDPFLSWTPTYLTAMNFDAQGAQDPAVERYGTDGAFDNNTFGWGHRLRHTLDYGSFLLCSNQNAQQTTLHGHPYVTALDLGLNVALTSIYKSHALQNFKILLEHFKGPIYCNFPYHQYLPTGRTRFMHLRRRETLLHRAVRYKHVEAIRSLIKADADIHMANNQWQTPLHVARLIEINRDPDARGNRGMFLGRIGFRNAPAVPISTTLEDPPAKQIRSILEKELMKSSLITSPWFRGLREVKWPWDDYETDDLGLRFVLFHLTTFVLVVSTVTLIMRLFMFWPYIFHGIAGALSYGLDALFELRDCYLGSLRNGTNPHVVCTTGRYDLAPLDLPMILPAFQDHLSKVIDLFDECYDNSTNAKFASSSAESDDGKDETLLPGCDDDVFDSDTWGRSVGDLDKLMYKFLEKECKCKCSWFGKPSMNFPI
ncbi:hypothetical protein BKA63DRAFT_453614 [Paraphoma chrysanthemicola]|nr:hypothetical protein BKA63DRAFT_453614 [Paraphoma chrysanthemicola]